MKRRSIAHIYATVLSDLCQDDASMNKAVLSLDAVNQLLVENALLKKTLLSQSLDVSVKEQLLEQLFKGKLVDWLLNFIKKIVEKNHIGVFPDIITVFKQLVGARMDKIIVRSITPIALTDKERETLLKKLQDASSAQIVLEEHVDPKIIGGIRLMFSNNKMIDFSIQTKLEHLKNMLKQKEMNHAT